MKKQNLDLKNSEEGCWEDLKKGKGKINDLVKKQSHI